MDKILISLILLISIVSCKEKDIDTFDGKNQVYFEKFYVDEVAPGKAEADSTCVSFFSFPSNTETINVPVIVCLSGNLLNRDIKFQLKVVEDQTTANMDEYTIDRDYIFHANNISKIAKNVIDTIYIKVHKTGRLESLEGGARLVVKLIPNDDVYLGQYERREAKIFFTTQAAQPDWWKDNVIDNLLGEYSQKKYKLFINHADTNCEMSTELIETNPSLAIKIVLRFKKWISEQDPAILDEDGELMTVQI